MTAVPQVPAAHGRNQRTVMLITAVTAALGAAAVLLGVTVCGTGQAKDGVVYGTVLGSGGPLTSPPRKTSSVPVRRMIVIAARAHERFQTVTSDDGTFSLSVPPGIYVIKAGCGAASPLAVTVRRGARVNRNIACQAV